MAKYETIDDLSHLPDGGHQGRIYSSFGLNASHYINIYSYLFDMDVKDRGPKEVKIMQLLQHR
jgi:hypothetical protein